MIADRGVGDERDLRRDSPARGQLCRLRKTGRLKNASLIVSVSAPLKLLLGVLCSFHSLQAPSTITFLRVVGSELSLRADSSS